MNNIDAAAICGDCNSTLGTNSACPACADWLVKTSAKDVDEQSATSILDEAADWLKTHVGVGPQHFFKQVGLLYEMLRDVIKRDYSIPWPSVGILVATLAYVISPFDLIPDFIPVLGWTDDAAVVAAAVRIIQSDLLSYAQSRDVEPADYGFPEL